MKIKKMGTRQSRAGSHFHALIFGISQSLCGSTDQNDQRAPILTRQGSSTSAPLLRCTYPYKDAGADTILNPRVAEIVFVGFRTAGKGHFA